MRRFALPASVLGSLLNSAAGAVTMFLRSCWDVQTRKYHPEDHYMRGPGPKWREKHVLGHASTRGT
jgi:hypothetical protein